jgi:hypothetical protein
VTIEGNGEGKRVWQGLGLLLSFDANRKTTREKDFSQILWLQRGRYTAAPFPSPCRLEVEKEREKGGF